MPRPNPLAPASDGRVSWGLAWRVCAFLPIVLLCVALTVRAVGGSNDKPTEAAGKDTSAVSSQPTGTAPILTTAVRDKKKQAAKSSKASEPTSEPTTDAPATEDPTKSPSPSPSPTDKPDPTPSPEEAREQCLQESGNLAELAECIADKMGG